MRRLSFACTLLFAAQLVCAPALLGAARALRVGAHAVDVSPKKLPVIVSGNFLAATAERQSGTLHARAVAIDDGAKTVVVAVVDSLMMPRELLDRIKRSASQKTGIPTERMLISATHTHSAPPVMGALGTDENPEYMAFVEERVVDAIAGAVRRMAPARVGWTTVDVPDLTNNRRWILRPDKMRKDPFGNLTVRAHMHPGYQNPDFVGPSGPVDPGLSLLSFQGVDGRPVALLANYSMHYVGAQGRTVSPDYFGTYVRKMESLIGAQGGDAPFVAIMSQGTSGDLHWMDYGRPQRNMDIDQYAETMASASHAAYRAIRYRRSVAVAMAETTLKLRRRAPDADRLAWARKIVAGMAGAPPKDQREVYAREQVLLDAEPERELKLQALRIGDLGITAIPNEVFALTGLKLKAQSPLQPTFNVELANGAEGYIPSVEQHALGGYTTWPARTAGLEVAAESRITETLLALLEQVAGRPRRPMVSPGGRYAKAVLSLKPLAYWRGDEVGGSQAVDITANRNTAAYDGVIAYYLDGPSGAGLAGTGAVNRAPHFAGGRMKARLKDVGERYSISMWFYNGLPADVRRVTGTLLSTSGGSLTIGGTAGAQGKLVLSGGGVSLEGHTALALRTWHHVTIVRDGKRVAAYLDGQTQPEIAGELPASANTDEGFVFAGADPASSLEGRLDEIAVYGRCLSGREAARLFAAGQ